MAQSQPVAVKQTAKRGVKEAVPAASEGRRILGSEDWWATFIGLGIVVLGFVIWAFGGTFNVFVAKIPSWGDWAFLFNGGDVTKNGVTTHAAGLIQRLPNIIALFALFAVVFGVAAYFLRLKVQAFLGGFLALFVLSFIVNVFSSSKFASSYNLEAPLVALVIGLVLGNLINLERFFGGALRTELFVKVGIVLLGATLPFTTIVTAGPVAFLQATFIAVSTFLVIYFAATRLFGLDKRFAATLGAGGSICGVSAGIAVGSAVKSRKEHVSAVISIVVVWAIISIFLLTALGKAFGLPDGVAGAWVGTSEFADAAGVTAASSFGEQGIAAFTLMKVVGRDIFIGVWCLILAFIAVTYWDRQDQIKEAKTEGRDPATLPKQKLDVAQIWHRFPKFVIGFFIASIFLTIVIAVAGTAASGGVTSDLITPIKELRTWAFTFTFLSIGLTTRFGQLSSLGWKPAAAFSIGAIVNIILGFILSAVILPGFWASIPVA
ncbi:YeiH family protein [Bifidobacterium tissieri]|uniref:YeiH family protein n=1 Tax=Bifidobacterium tissieri TaxID=1630162 RepID=UPI00123A8910|nr:putative sulfate exporter family transporter [Bifidobacterium tissieri]KAA8832385.1 putative sulfate exporter family transporter [Bifidobacterium tissieri]